MAEHSAPDVRRRRGFGLVVVRGRSMQPALHDGDVLLVRWSYAAASRAGVGRLAVVLLPDGRPPAVKRLTRREPDGSWWVERDNPREGVDSWLVGALPAQAVIGLVVARVAPHPRAHLGHARPRGA